MFFPSNLQLIKKATSDDDHENLDICLDLNDVIEYIGDTVPPLFSSVISSPSVTASDTKTPEFPTVVKDMLEKVLVWTTGKLKFEVYYYKYLQ